jgi:hypothetical protein
MNCLDTISLGLIQAFVSVIGAAVDDASVCLGIRKHETRYLE